MFLETWFVPHHSWCWRSNLTMIQGLSTWLAMLLWCLQFCNIPFPQFFLRVQNQKLSESHCCPACKQLSQVLLLFLLVTNQTARKTEKCIITGNFWQLNPCAPCSALLDIPCHMQHQEQRNEDLPQKEPVKGHRFEKPPLWSTRARISTNECTVYPSFVLQILFQVS